MSDVTTVPAQTPRRWPLYASLFLNVVLLTGLAIGAWRIHQAREAFGGIGAWMPGQIERVLPPETAAKVKAIRAAHAAEFRPLVGARRTARDGVTRALGAEPFDAAALRGALKAMQAADAAFAEATMGIMVEIAEVLSPAERKLVIERARDRPRGPGRGPRGDKDMPDGMPPPDGELPFPPPPPPGGP